MNPEQLEKALTRLILENEGDREDIFNDVLTYLNPLVCTSSPKVPEFYWVCNECGGGTLPLSTPEAEIECEIHACMECGGFEFHKEQLPF